MVSPPSEAELFTDMLKGDAGSADGLQILGVIGDFILENQSRQEQGLPPIQRGDPIRVSKAKLLYEYVRWKLGDIKKLHLLPDMFHFEHLLCKVKRVLTYGPHAYTTFEAFQGNFRFMLELSKQRRAQKEAAKKAKMKKKDR